MIKLKYFLLIITYIIVLIYSILNITMMKYEDIELNKFMNSNKVLKNVGK